MLSTTSSAHHDPVLALRPATADDARALARLAALDESLVPAGPVLLGLLDGEPVAALALRDGSVVADPFVATGEVRELLRARAAHLAGPEQPLLRRLAARLGQGERHTAAWVG
jgi:hypothetical protein